VVKITRLDILKNNGEIRTRFLGSDLLGLQTVGAVPQSLENRIYFVCDSEQLARELAIHNLRCNLFGLGVSRVNSEGMFSPAG
jgi:hypothetical protein